MSLRVRLVVALVGLVTLGLAVFGTATYSLYARAEFQRLDDELRASEPLIDLQLDVAAGDGASTLQPTTAPTTAPLPTTAPPPTDGGRPGPGGRSPQGGRGGPPVFVPPGTFAELLAPSGVVLARLQFADNAAQPLLPPRLPVPTIAGRIFEVGSTTGSGGFRVLDIAGRGGATTVIAVPLTAVRATLHLLVLIEGATAIGLLLALSAGAWLILRRGLRPLERMAGQARSISAGDLSQRVSPAGRAGDEIGELGLALNTMLDDIEVAFSEREATEVRLRLFLADASHELRTPLTSIQGFAELFRVSGENARVDLPTILRRIEQEAARMKLLVDDLLLLAHLDQLRVIERAPVDLGVLAADACSDAVATEPTRSITLDVHEPVVVAGDQGHLRQAIANLMTNAIRHTPSSAGIEVAVRLEGGMGMVTVRDHGPGLDEEALIHVFDRFWQADRARVGTGAGLGLAIVAGIAHEHGGIATAESRPDGGASFTISLPIGGAADGAAPQARRRA